MNIPANLKYTKDHEWISLDGDVATVGITDFAQKELGDIVYVEVETLDQTLDAEEVFGTVEAVKWLDGDPKLQVRESDGTLVDLEMSLITQVQDPQAASDSDTNGSTDNSGADGTTN